ncbi:sucrose synthase 2-like [Brassica napus]|uniref:sucrose synthase 2-like n=1 Tax=Brassica oleracea var. oleracea TaxID=109376 RepID=UPI0006A70F85|nr:PREDICTED: sucrose synthase 2-like [Brassica oleracea var. oleracea]XP_048603824.1 sucrose synthase 2-like [Brassica napus]
MTKSSSSFWHKDGNVGFWNLDCQNEEEDGGVSLFKPHTYSVTSLVFQQNSFSKVATTLVSFFETCNADPSHWEKISDGGLERIYERYTWKKYSERLLTLAGVYSFWKHVSKLERRETRRYLEMFYSLKFRDLVSVIHSSFFQFLRLVYLYDHITTC